MTLLIIGKTGQLGSALIEEAAKRNHIVFSTSKQELDILNESAFANAIEQYRPDVVINTAAFHNVPLCEKEPLAAFQSNCIAVGKMAKITSDLGAWFVSFSTDYVFGGEKKSPYIETDKPNPLQIYGLSKLAGEYAALSYPNSIIIRTCGLYGLQGAASKKGNFVDNRINDSKKNKRLEISSEQTISPTSAAHLSQAVLRLIEHPSKESGIYHLVNEGCCTWFEFAREIFKILGKDIDVVPVNRRGMDGEMRRPLFSALKNKKAAELGIVLPHWKEGLKEYLNAKYSKNDYLVNV